MNRDNLLALAERCEKATGPDRELDALIEKALPPTDRHFAVSALPQARTLYNQRAARFYGARIGMNDSDADYTPTAYTASLDAAMTLVPEGWDVRLEIEQAGKAFWSRLENWWTAERIVGHGKSLALALTAAALRARAAMEEA